MNAQRRSHKSSGAFWERLREAWIELRENPGRSTLQALGVMLGVASVLGGFSIADSQRQQAERLFARLGGIDKLNVLPTDVVYLVARRMPDSPGTRGSLVAVESVTASSFPIEVTMGQVMAALRVPRTTQPAESRYGTCARVGSATPAPIRRSAGNVRTRSTGCSTRARSTRR